MEDQLVEVDALAPLEVVVDLCGVHLVVPLVVPVGVPHGERHVEEDLHAVPAKEEQQRQRPRHNKLWEDERVNAPHKLDGAKVDVQVTERHKLKKK